MSSACNLQSNFLLSQRNLWNNIEGRGKKVGTHNIMFKFSKQKTPFSSPSCSLSNKSNISYSSSGKFGEFGGKFVPELLMTCLNDLEDEFHKALNDAKFQVGYFS